MRKARGQPIPLDQYFAGRDALSRELFEVVRSAIEEAGPATLQATKSQVVFRHRLAFAWTWMPGQCLRTAADVDDEVIGWLREAWNQAE